MESKKKKKAGLEILVSDKTDFKPTKIKRQRRALHNGNRINATRKANYTNNSGRLYHPLSILDRSSRQITSKDIQNLNSALGEVDVTDIYRTLHSKTTKKIFLKQQGTYSKIDHIIGSKTLLSKFKRTEILIASQTTVQSD